MKKIVAKFNSTCAETGAKIKKGTEMYYDYASKKCYCMASKKAQEQTTGTAGNDFVQDPGEQFFDNFCTNNAI